MTSLLRGLFTANGRCLQLYGQFYRQEFAGKNHVALHENAGVSISSSEVSVM